MGRMNKRIVKKLGVPVLILLLVITNIQLLEVKSESKSQQKKADIIYFKAISDTMEGINLNCSNVNREQKIQGFYQMLYNLKDAMEVFFITSYKENEDIYGVLNKLYIYLLENYVLPAEGEANLGKGIQNDYVIENSLSIFEYLGKIMVYPNDKQVIADFNEFLDGRKSKSR